MNNPFIFGEAVQGRFFIDREQEMRDLMRDLGDCQKVFLISPRRYGKTSLALSVVDKLRKRGFIPIYLDLQKSTNYKHFLETYSSHLISNSTRADKFLAMAKEVMPAITFEVTVDAEGRSKLKLSFPSKSKDIEDTAVRIYEMPSKIARKTGKKVVIALDEFQDIVKFDGGSVEKTMRAVFQHQRAVGYLFAGSKKHLMEEMIGNESRPFYHSGPVYYLKKIPVTEWKTFVKTGFSQGRIRIADEIIEKIIQMCNEIPYFIQALCHELWDHCSESKPVRIEEVERVLEGIITRHQDLYLAIWDRLTSYKRQVLWTIANFGGKNILSMDYIAEHDLVSPSNLQKTVEQLQKEDLVDKESDTYFFPNVFFREWIIQKIE